MSDQGTGGKLVLARLGSSSGADDADGFRPPRRVALIVDEDDRALRAMDLDTGRELSTVTFDGMPSSALVLRDGRIVVTLADRARAVVLEPTDPELGALEPLCTVEVGVEPVAMAVTPDESALGIVSRWDATLAIIDLRSGARRATVLLERDPWSVIATADGERMVVAHAAGSRTSVVELSTNAVTTHDLALRSRSEVSLQRRRFEKKSGPPRTLVLARTIHRQSSVLVRAERVILAPGVSTDTGNGIRSFDGGYGEDGPVVGTVTVLDPVTGAPRAQPDRVPLGKRDCVIPRAAAIDGARLHVACSGIDAVLSLDANRSDPRIGEDALARRRVSAGPAGIAVDSERRELVVFSELDRVVTIDHLGPRSARVTLPLPARRSVLPEDVELGRRVFFGGARKHLADDGRACVSCHPGGRDDGLTWTTPDGPRQTPILADRLAGTAPYGWNGAVPGLDAHLQQTVSRLHGTGLDARERAGLIAYLATLRSPGGARDPDPSIARGAELFASEAVGCAGCHATGGADGLGHDVGGRARGDRVFAIDTPSLRHLARSAPYFHDGRFASLDTLLAETDGTMGHTAQLSSDDRAALISYLRSL